MLTFYWFGYGVKLNEGLLSFSKLTDRFFGFI